MTINFNSRARKAIDQRHITAEHEAAHATAYLALGYPIHRVEIEPEGFTLSTPRPALRPLQDVATTTAAGLVVEARYGTIPLDEQLAETIDLVEAGWDINELGDLGFFAKHPELLAPSLITAEDLLAANRRFHERTTKVLLKRGFLTAKTVPTFNR